MKVGISLYENNPTDDVNQLVLCIFGKECFRKEPPSHSDYIPYVC
jgi:hypothetical protein